MQLLSRFLRAGIAEAETGLWFPSDKGVPQGGPLSPLLSNIILDELDKKLTREQLHFARYADDTIILVKSKFIGNKVKVAISHYIRKRLKLIVNEKKSRVGPVSGSTFLGFGFSRGGLQSHTKKSIHTIAPNLYFDTDINMYRAKTTQAIIDLKNCNRNMSMLES